MDLNNEQISILKHCNSTTGWLYCGDSSDMQELVKLGLMEAVGRKSFVPDEYFRITPLGRKIGMVIAIKD